MSATGNNYGMGRIYQRGRVWWLQYSLAGEKFRESSKSERRGDAVKLLKQRLSEIQIGEFSGPKADRITINELLDDLLIDYRVRGRKSQKNVESKSKHLRQHLGRYRAQSVTADRVKGYIVARQDEGAKPATINRELAALKRAYNIAIRGKKLPITSKPDIVMLREDNVRMVFFTEEEFQRVRTALPHRYRALVTFAFYNGWRRNNLYTLEWRQVDLDRGDVRLDPGSTKNDAGQVIFLAGELLEIMREQRLWVTDLELEQGRVIPWVFPNEYSGDHIRSHYYAWNTACRRVGLGGRWLHDFRRSATRELLRSGVLEPIAMRITGHKTRSIFDRYNIVSEDDLREAARRRAHGHAGLEGHNSGTIRALPVGPTHVNGR